MKRVLVLCTGNSSRSQMAEGYLKFYADGKLEVYSAGVKDLGVNPLAVEAMGQDNIDISEHFSKPLEYFHGESFDYLISVCELQEDDILEEISFRKFFHYEVKDPAVFEGSKEEALKVFDEAREKLKRKMLKFLGKILYQKA